MWNLFLLFPCNFRFDPIAVYIPIPFLGILFVVKLFFSPFQACLLVMMIGLRYHSMPPSTRDITNPPKN